MCGIAGSTAASREMLGGFLQQLRHRGPDGTGLWLEDGTGFAHTRLAVIDLTEGGRQPMLSSCRRWVISYNGEIYNYRALRWELEQAGARFRTDSDTEVLLELLKRNGPDGLHRVAGMFAFSLWDRERSELLLARDRFGIKPLVWAPLPDGGLAFASEIEALRSHPGVDDSIDPEAISRYLACLYVPAPLTGRRGIRKLPPGHLIRWRAGSTSVERWWRPQFGNSTTMTIEEAVSRLVPAIRQAVSDHTVADVPIGCFLSGGIDSSVVAALMAENARLANAAPIKTFTMTFVERTHDERNAARAVANHIGSTHQEIDIQARGVAEQLPAFLRSFGEPFGNPTAFLVSELSKAARNHVTVALVGDGGDEIFCGYPRYMGGLYSRRWRKLPGWLRQDVAAWLIDMLPDGAPGHHTIRRAREFIHGTRLTEPEMYASWVEYFDPAERQRLLGLAHLPSRPIAELYQSCRAVDALDAMQVTDLLSFLPGNLLAYGDAMSMAHALEIRLPLLDHRILEVVGRIPASTRISGGLKTLLRRVAARHLPSWVAKLPKRGFNPPLGHWLRDELAPIVGDRLTASRLSAIGINPQYVATLLDQQARGQRDHALKIWAILMLELWARP